MESDLITPVPDQKIYVYIYKTDNRFYKVCTYAKEEKQAKQYRNNILSHYIKRDNQSDMRDILNNDAIKDNYQMQNSQSDIANILAHSKIPIFFKDQLKQCIARIKEVELLEKSLEELKLEKAYVSEDKRDEYFGRNYKPPCVKITVLEGIEGVIEEFAINPTTFENNELDSNVENILNTLDDKFGQTNLPYDDNTIHTTTSNNTLYTVTHVLSTVSGAITAFSSVLNCSSARKPTNDGEKNYGAPEEQSLMPPTSQ